MKVYVTEEFEAYHKWDEAPDEVAFLRNLHRHIFKVKVYIEVTDDREIEFIMLKWLVRKFVRENFEMKVVESCEWIGRQLKEWLSAVFPNRKIEVDVSEDGENGVIV